MNRPMLRGLFQDALAAFDAALRLEPDAARAHCERGQVLLRLGRHAEGWPEFEWRWRLPDMGPLPSYRTPAWNGAPVSGAVIVWPEQGFGDAILSARFLPGLRERVGRFVLGVKPELSRLFSELAGVDTLVAMGARQPAHVAHASMMSLPGFAMRDPRDLPPPPARLHVPAEARARLAPVIAQAGRRLKVGIVWSGSVTFKANAQRATTLDRFLSFAEVRCPEHDLTGITAQVRVSEHRALRRARRPSGVLKNGDVLVGVDHDGPRPRASLDDLAFEQAHRGRVAGHDPGVGGRDHRAWRHPDHAFGRSRKGSAPGQQQGRREAGRTKYRVHALTSASVEIRQSQQRTT
jgi:hypothetical protein